MNIPETKHEHDKPASEVERIRERYERRKVISGASHYDYLHPSLYLCHQERERAIIRCLSNQSVPPLQCRTLLEIGCGPGFNLQQFIHMGFLPEHVVGNELLEHESQRARHLLPQSVRIVTGDALELNLAEESFDVVVLSTVMSSILDDNFQQSLANKAWSLVKPGGGILWYDFVYNNPRNKDVCGVPLRRLRELFSQGAIHYERITLAPPLSRVFTRIHPALYTVLNVFPFLRTHLLAWVGKPSA